MHRQARAESKRDSHSLAKAGEMGLVAYITAGDPSLDATEKIVLAAAEAGADVIELGRPIQRSRSGRAHDPTRERTRACAPGPRLRA